MSSRNSTQSAKEKRVAALYNMALNLLWSGLGLVPLCVYGYRYFGAGLLWSFVALSTLPFFFPNRLLDEMRMVRRSAFYKKIGVGLIQQLSQNGTLVNRLVRKQYPGYKVLRPRRKSVRGLLAQTFLFEKFHWALFLLFCFSAVHAWMNARTGWTILLSGINLLYNVYPILLQQFIRTKMRFGNQGAACSGPRS